MLTATSCYLPPVLCFVFPGSLRALPLVTAPFYNLCALAITPSRLPLHPAHILLVATTPSYLHLHHQSTSTIKPPTHHSQIITSNYVPQHGASAMQTMIPSRLMHGCNSGLRT
ncbi:hypothetical protein EDB19DRAFT_1679218 [Suillus lakei]|nr:hypothetical protein EDB19DRAFT_1679218 [Suillus lakei]